MRVAQPQRAACLVHAHAGTMCEYLLPSLVLVHPLPLVHWRALQQLPSLMYRLEGMVAALEFREKVVLPLG